MKPTIRVSIGTVAFNVDEDAYTLLNEYLQALRQHFASSDESEEIIYDIEMRLCELLQMRIKSEDNVISANDAQEIINIMGSPKDFGDQDTHTGDNTKSNTKKDNYDSFAPKKKLYRDPSQGAIAGVCSGLSHFFKTDVVIFRLLFLLIFVIGIFGWANLAFSVGVVYLVLWVVMPKARSFEEKVAMMGSSKSIENIERGASFNKKYKGSFVGEALSFIFKAILIILGIIMTIAIIAILAFAIWACLDTDILYTNNYLDLMGLDKSGINTAVQLFLLLPLIGIVCLIIKLYRGSSFKTQNLVLLLLGIVVWIGAGVYLGNKTGTLAYKMKNNAQTVEQVNVETESNTLFLELDKEYIEANQQPSNPFMLYRTNDRVKEVCILPYNIRVEVSKDSLVKDFTVEFTKTAFGDTRTKAQYQADNMEVAYQLSDSLIALRPQWHHKNNPWKAEQLAIKVIAPMGKKVEIVGYLKGGRNFNGTWNFANKIHRNKIHNRR